MTASPDPSPLSKPILIVAAGKTFPDIRETQGDFDDWIAAGLGDAVPQRRIDAQQEAASLPDPSELSAVVVSGSHAMVSHREPWSEQLALWMRRCVEAQVPVLGICYGHQLLAHAFGGHVDNLPGGPEVGTHTVRLTAEAAQDTLFAGLPGQFPAQLVHYQSVLRLPDGAVLLAHSGLEPHQAFRVGGCGWGVQFHPEFSARAMQAYVEHVQEARNAHVSDTSEAGSVLGRFAAMVVAGS
jgi:GMP synthase (glutamine-hydrolysing)